MECVNCERKQIIPLIKCRCGKKVCLQCRYPDKHRCTFDYRSYDRTMLLRKMPQIVAPKLTRV